MKHAKLPFQLLPIKTTNKFGLISKGLFLRISQFIPGLKYDLVKANYDVTASEYVSYSFVHAKIFAILSFLLLFPLSILVAERTFLASFQIGFIASLAVFVLFFIALLKYPTISAGKISEQIDKNLVYGLKDLLLQVSSGITLDQAIANVADADYGQISQEFDKITRDIKTGTPMIKALEKMALTTKSQFLKRTVWQMVNSIRAGTNVKGALKTVIQELITEQQNSIKNYAKELNLWTLMYMLFAVAIPSIGGTLLIVLSSFAGAGLSKASFILFLLMGFIIQIGLIEFIKSRRPVINI